MCVWGGGGGGGEGGYSEFYLLRLGLFLGV